jgi:hypothetical protein
MNQEVSPEDNSLKIGMEEDPEGQAKDSAEQAELTPWYEEMGFSDEETAIASAQNAQRKISEQGRELSDFRRAQTQAPQQPSAQPEETKITSEQFYENPADAIARASEQASRRVFTEYQQKQDNDRMIADAAKENNVSVKDVEDVFYDMNHNPARAVQLLAMIAGAQQGTVNTSEVKAAIDRAEENKSRATGTVAGNHKPVDTEPDWDAMSYEDAMKELAKRGLVESQKGGFTTNS